MDNEPTITDWDGIKAQVARREEEARTRYEQMRNHARAGYRAMEGWQSVKSEADWLHLVDEAHTTYYSGRFLIDQMGGEGQLHPELLAILWNLRQGIIAQHEPMTLQEMMVIDLGIIAYHHALRVNSWIGNLAFLIEAEFFDQPGLTITRRLRKGQYYEELRINDHLHRISEELLPLLDRANRMLIRNLQTIQELRRRPVAAVAINRASQVNVAGQQINIADEGN